MKSKILYCRVLIIVWLILIVSFGAFAQQTKLSLSEEKDLVPQRVAFMYNTRSPYAPQLAALMEYLKIAFAEYSQTVLVYQNPDVTVSLDAAKSQSGISLTILALRTDTNAKVIDTATVFPNLQLTTVTQFLTNIAKDAGKLLPPLPQKERVVVTEKVVEKTETIQVARGVTITFQGQPGTNIQFLNHKKNAQLDNEGKYSLEQAQNTSIKFRASLPGYIPEERVLFVGKDNITITIDLKKMPILEIEGTLRYANLVPGIYTRYYLKPERLSIIAGGETSALALIPFMKAPFPYFEASAGASLLLEDPLAFLSMCVTMRLMGRVTIAEGALLFPSELPAALVFDTAVYAKIAQAVRLSLGITLRLGYFAPPYANIPELQPLTAILFNLAPNWNVTLPDPYLAIRIGL